ncbi:hypothetical protein [Orenia marismortui]|uniref:Uncharacterized protein n=1 Tax=Orenia marismortui TaxID=46469 RepID=A0A4R8H1K1_9FIRM|nr:hypothetical protein [Orenia marismortui]TDX48440.1 hypothetical protein C7959_1279 [Orenia marismortui]
MSEKKISSRQAFLLSLNVVLATILLLVPSEVIKESGVNAWLAIIISGFIVAYFLENRKKSKV